MKISMFILVLLGLAVSAGAAVSSDDLTDEIQKELEMADEAIILDSSDEQFLEPSSQADTNGVVWGQLPASAQKNDSAKKVATEKNTSEVPIKK